jgi:hypothetical protein
VATEVGGEAATAQIPEPNSETPASLSAAVRIEAKRAFHPPYETPIVVAVNGALMSSCWVFLPGSLKDKILRCMARWRLRLYSLGGCTPTCQPPMCSVRTAIAFSSHLATE